MSLPYAEWVLTSANQKEKTQNNKVVINPPKSWFELNVIDKNVQERKEMEKAIGLTKMVEDLRKSDGIVDDINDNSSEESFHFDVNDN